jgi:hypothetical protein
VPSSQNNSQNDRYQGDACFQHMLPHPSPLLHLDILYIGDHGADLAASVQ